MPPRKIPTPNGVNRFRGSFLSNRRQFLVQWLKSNIVDGHLVKLADTQDLGSCAARRRGSTPRVATARVILWSRRAT